MRYVTGSVVDTLVSERKMAFVAGPRQVGKTTLARSLLRGKDAGYFNWDVETHRRRILRDPEGFWSEAIDSGPGPRPRIVLDEIHKSPRWKRFLKGVFDLHRSVLRDGLRVGASALDGVPVLVEDVSLDQGVPARPVSARPSG